MTNHYAAAIDVLTSNHSQARLMAILTNIAKAHPKMVVDAARPYLVKPAKWIQWKKPIAYLINEGRFIAAIKELRILTGVGLKEAKGICDEFRDSGEYRRYL
ncbi:MAG: hypothetical protein JEZ11_03725 [Desulfobacterales bacterium]|nr:hypothetical protein [Desulfobacterales bacterium]